MKMFLQTIIGLILIIGGIYIMYMYIETLDSNSNILLLLGSILMLTGGVFSLIRAGKSDTIILNRTRSTESDTDIVTTPPIQSSGLENTVEKNNAMLHEWKKTNETKDRLRLLEIQAAEQASDN